MTVYLQLFIDGVLVGSVFALMAVGFSLVWGVVRIINLTQGELVMLGGFLTYWVATVLRWNPFAALPLAAALLFLLGYGIQRGILNRATHASLFMTLLITFGLSIAIRQLGIQLWTANVRTVTAPFAGVSLQVGGTVISVVKLIAFGAALLLTAATWILLTSTRIGFAIRATAQNPQAAALMGVNLSSVYAFTFGINAAVAGAAGVLISMIWPLYPHMGVPLTIRSFIIVILGGLGSIPGALLGGLTLGLVESYGAYLFGISLQEALAFGLLVLILLLRPRGLFGWGLQG